ncbi:MAG: isochorismatase family protein [Bdellovibrionales bacterium]|nr:isochorismatase family protein [Bdellovibrionales bacterium]
MQKILGTWLSVLALALSYDAYAAGIPKSEVAVVLIDMQPGFYKRGGVVGSQGLKDLVAEQSKLLNWAVQEGVPVLIFEYSGFQPTNISLTDLLVGSTFKAITKYEDDGFGYDSHDEAVQTLDSWGAKTLIAAGINGPYCVRSTVLGALAAGYDVISSPAITGNINHNPPTYPNTTWYSPRNKFTILPDLASILALIDVSTP